MIIFPCFILFYHTPTNQVILDRSFDRFAQSVTIIFLYSGKKFDTLVTSVTASLLNTLTISLLRGRKDAWINNLSGYDFFSDINCLDQGSQKSATLA